MDFDLQRFGTSKQARFLLAHGAGAGKESAYLQFFAQSIAAAGIECILFNFPYMTLMQETGKRRPPERAPKLLDHFRSLISHLNEDDGSSKTPLIIGGKSMGGRMASMLMAEDPALADGLLLLGYPFHPPGKPEKLRTAHLKDITAPTLLIQGERDTFGGRAFLEKLSLPDTFETHLSPDGDHSFKPRKASGHTQEGNWAEAVRLITQKKW
ncbi:MAG: alpha/beta fold hydrolase [Kordiimonadaceae bacterium]|nr:alpha/beta fold hydrolase [Kordiimonadaceae bacterium]